MLQRYEGALAYTKQILPRLSSETVPAYVIANCFDYPELFEASIALENDTWDDLSFLDFTAAHHAHYDKLLEQFPEYRLCMIDTETGELVATGMCVPLQADLDQTLPPRGWDWIVETAQEQKGRGANAIAALSISVPEQYRRNGLARDLVLSMRGVARTKFLPEVIAPVRPSAKTRYPDVAMTEYIQWRDPQGRIFDPWLRSHVAAGGRVDGVCELSMVVEQPLEFWRTWAGLPLNDNGKVHLDGALAPIEIDVTKGIGRYVEPNVWVRHAV